ncbi:MAG: hypothetical protein ACW99U_20865 [Candidatus Thorarchaeota archaeon]|jgi:hypothetical protein
MKSFWRNVYDDSFSPNEEMFVVIPAYLMKENVEKKLRMKLESPQIE